MPQKHGLSKTPEYRIWAGIKQRCFNSRRAEHARYGGSGITMCREWAADFGAFYSHLGPRPTPGHSVDRVNGALGYEPGNVRWATAEEQAQNSSIARPITLNGRTLTASEWARELSIGFTTIIARLNRGLPPEEVLSKGRLVGRGCAPAAITFEGRTQTISRWAAEIGVERRVLKKRLKAGVPLSRAMKNPMPPR